MPTIFVTGGSGYLGSHLVTHLVKEGHQVGYTFLTNDVPEDTFGAAARGFRVNLSSGEGLDEALQALGPVGLVVNTAAISQPALCQRDYDLARALNVPERLVAALERQKAATGAEPLLVHLSTDQVYEGTRAWWSEEDEVKPVNAYGRSKAEAEAFLASRWPRSVSLRSSLIFGPQPPFPVGRPLFVQFVEERLRGQVDTDFFEDEFRCPIYVFDICGLVSRFLSALPSAPPHATYNLGGPDRMSRVDMAVAVAEHMGYGKDCIKAIPGASVVNRGYNSPPDISMKMDRLREDLPGVKLTPFSEALAQVFPEKDHHQP